MTVDTSITLDSFVIVLDNIKKVKWLIDDEIPQLDLFLQYIIKTPYIGDSSDIVTQVELLYTALIKRRNYLKDCIKMQWISRSNILRVW